MKNQEDIIRQTIEEVIKYPKEIFLFGSRAQDNNRTDSDFDILVVVDAVGITRRRLIEMGADIRRRCAKKGIDVDIIVRDREYVQNMRNLAGNIINEAMSYGVPI